MWGLVSSLFSAIDQCSSECRGTRDILFQMRRQELRNSKIMRTVQWDNEASDPPSTPQTHLLRQLPDKRSDAPHAKARLTQAERQRAVTSCCPSEPFSSSFP